MQTHGFEWDLDLSLEEMLEKYKDSGITRSRLKWWANTYEPETSRFNIAQVKYLKEFINQNPPQFKISAQCCTYAKKKASSNFNKSNEVDLVITGVRRSEGGVRGALKTCVSYESTKTVKYHPIFWFKNSDKKQYEKAFNITHSRCYTEYGLQRTGCVGCPFGPGEKEAAQIHPFEPHLYTAAMNVFKDSYEYTRAYREFVRDKTRGNQEVII